MLVDDDELYLETMMGELEERGFAVRGFLDGPSLLKALDRSPDADALLLDWTLPSMSGIDVLSGVRDRGIDVPVAFLTGRALVDYEHIALGRGAVDFIDKLRGADVIAQRLNRMVVGGRRRPVVTTPEAEAPQLCGSLSLWQRSPRIEWRGADVGLTITEYNIISLLVANIGKPLTYRAIYDTMHYEGFMAGYGTDGYLVNVRSALKRIRKKFLAVDSAFVEIENYAGMGYSWRSPAQV